MSTTATLHHYDVTAWKDFTSYSTLTVQAESPAAAIEKARELFDDAEVDDWHECDDAGQPIHFMHAEPNEDAEGNPSTDDPAHNADWLALGAPDNRALIDAARAMLAALETVLAKVDAPAHRASMLEAVRDAITMAEAAGIKPAARLEEQEHCPHCGMPRDSAGKETSHKWFCGNCLRWNDKPAF